MHGQGFFSMAFIFLLAAVISVPLAKRLGLGSVLGYLIAGALIGPFVLGLVGEEGEDIMHFAEFGVVLMLFLIGLELKPSRLWQLRGPVLGLGGLQVGLTTALLGGIAMAAGWDWKPALAVGLSLALSSTAIVLQTLAEKGWIRTDAGQNAFAVLLFQDVAVIPILAILPMLASPELLALDPSTTPLDEIPAALRTVSMIGAMTLIVVVGRWLVGPALRIMVKTRLRELSLAAALALVIGTALLMEKVGLSAALGSFLAGMVLAGSEYRHELEANIEPFKGLLLGVFFIAVGASLDFAEVMADPGRIAAMTGILIGVKIVVLVILGRVFGLRRDQNLLFTLVLAQGGEFAFVLLSFAVQQSVMTEPMAAPLIVAVTLSMALTPLLLLLYERVLQPLFGTCPRAAREEDTVDEKGEVIIVGFGQFGSTLGRLLRTAGVAPTVLDADSDQVEIIRQLGLPVFYGDASRADLLRAAGAETARLLILALDDPDTQLRIVELAKKEFPQARIIARARGWLEAQDLWAAGVEHVFRENLDSSLRAGGAALTLLGHRAHEAHRLTRRFRRRDEENLRDLLAHRGDRGEFLNAARERIHDLEQLMRAELEEERSSRDLSWDVDQIRRELSGDESE